MAKRKTKYAYQVFGTTFGKYRNSLCGNYKTKKSATKCLNEYKRIPIAKDRTLTNLRVKKIKMKKWNTYLTK